jgi:DNA-binding SARP family transcriptional activator
MSAAPEGGAMRELRVRIWGPFEIVQDDGTSRALTRKAQQLLALLLLAPQRNMRREVAADAVWQTAGPDASRKAMRQALWQIHQATDAADSDSPRLVLTDAETIRINPERPVWLDVEEFKAVAGSPQAEHAETLSEERLDELAAASDLYRGSLLDGCDDEWCLVARTRLEDLHLTVLDRLSTAHEQRGRPGAAILWAQRLLEIEPAHERSHRRLMRLYYEIDDRTRALRQYQRCRWVLEHDLGIRPSSRTEALAAAIGAGVLAAATSRPSATERAADGRAASPEGLPTSGPVPVHLLDGLRAELAALRASVDAIGDQLRGSASLQR